MPQPPLLLRTELLAQHLVISAIYMLWFSIFDVLSASNRIMNEHLVFSICFNILLAKYESLSTNRKDEFNHSMAGIPKNENP
jgi:hypothetical protein